jgi:hypothetical protein
VFARFIPVAAAMLLFGCLNGEPKQGKPMDKPFMEHPSGKYETAVMAMADAIERLRAMPEWNDWITFTAQGTGSRVDSYHFAEIRMRQDEVKLQQPIEIDIELVTHRAGVPGSCFSKSGDLYSIGKATPMQAARIMDVIFHHYLGIWSNATEGNDYAVGAEWQRR